jgi:ParB/RepB/Spo0J family partition protein
MKLENIKLADIKAGINPRIDVAGVDELSKSIESVGLLQPIVVRKSQEGFVLVDGSRRLAALKLLKQTETQVAVLDLTTEDAVEASLAANLMRTDLNLIERMRACELMVTKYPARYNAAGIAKSFGGTKATVDRMISASKRISAKLDAKLMPKLGRLEFADIEILAQVPAAQQEKVVDAIGEHGGVRQALAKTAKALDWNCDAITTGKLVSAGKAFVVKSRGDGESAYTFDAEAHKEAREAYEKKHKQEYGAATKQHVEKVKEKTEAQKTKEREARKKEKEKQDAAVKALFGEFKKFIKKAPNQTELHAAAREAFERHVDSDKCRRLWTAFGVEGCSKVSSYELRGVTYDKVIKPHIKFASEAIMLVTFLSLGWKEGQTPEVAWVTGMAKR